MKAKHDDGTRRRLVPMMFTDVVGYTTLTQKNEQNALELLEEHRRLLRPIYATYGGREVKTIGDAFLVEFSSVLDAMNCAVRVQETLWRRNLDSPEERRIEVRIGLHLGDVVLKDGDVYGDAVNIASRIVRLAEPGGICISEQVYYQIRNKEDFSFVSLGPRELKNVQLPMEVYKMEMPWEKESAGEAHGSNRVAVLPFVNISPDPSDEYFADGLTEELISTISNIGQLSVISRTSAMSYKGAKKKVREIGRELDVGSVLEGSVRKAGNRIRITIQLIDVSNDKHLWAQSYDRQLDDVFVVQSDIAKQVADALRVKILPKERHQIEKTPTRSTEAYTLYLKGRYYWNERGKESLYKAIEYFKRAIEFDPNYALAYAGISDCYGVLGDHQHIPYDEAWSKCLEYATKAVEKDGSSAEARTSLAGAIGVGGSDWERSEMEFKKAIQLNPSYATAHQWYGIVLLRTGRLDEALREASMAQRLDPLSPMINTFVGIVHYMSRKFDLAEAHIKRALELEPEFTPGYANLFGVHLMLGKYSEAKKDARELMRLGGDDPRGGDMLAAAYAFEGRKEEARKMLSDQRLRQDRYASPWGKIIANIALGEKDKAIDLIVKEYEMNAKWLPEMAFDPLYSGVLSDPRVADILKKVQGQK